SVYFPHPPAKIEAPPFGTKIKSLRLTSQRMEEAALVRNVTEFGDNALVSAYLEGNETAFEVLMTRYQGRLANYINGILHDYDRSVELCQETFIRVFRNAHRYQGKYQFSTWLYRIATNLAIDELRRRQRKGRFFLYNIMELFSRDERPMPLPDRRQSPDLKIGRASCRERVEIKWGGRP